MKLWGVPLVFVPVVLVAGFLVVIGSIFVVGSVLQGAGGDGDAAFCLGPILLFVLLGLLPGILSSLGNISFELPRITKRQAVAGVLILLALFGTIFILSNIGKGSNMPVYPLVHDSSLLNSQDEQGVQCPGVSNTWLTIGQHAEVSTNSLNLRSDASLGGSVLVKMRHGTVVYVAGCPVYIDGYWWWWVSPDGTTYGWAAEADSNETFLVPAN